MSLLDDEDDEDDESDDSESYLVLEAIRADCDSMIVVAEEAVSVSERVNDSNSRFFCSVFVAVFQ